MTDQLWMFPPMTSEATSASISSQELPDGTLLSTLPAGEVDLFGVAAAHVNLSPSPAKAAVARTNGTYGRIGAVSSASADLTSYLARTLKQRLDGAGSTLFSATWRRKVTPRGRWYWVHTALARRTSGKDFGSWQSPTTENRIGNYETAMAHRRNAERLDGQVYLASWPTPGAAEGSGEMRPSRAATGRTTGYLAEMATLASWPTPTGEDSSSSGAAGYSTESGRHSGTTLTDAARASWATPVCNSPNSMRGSGQDPAKRKEGGHAVNLQDQVTLVSGPTSSGSPAATERRGQLNPAFSLWLQGYPAEWGNCAPRGTRSSRKPPPPS
jgi:hypothetical protein